jgi:hypothetical protein
VSDEEKKEEKKERKPKQIAVKVVESKGKSALVQWRDGDDLRRAYVPADKVKGDQCDEDTLKAGIPYGVPWEQLITIKFDPVAIARLLRQRGIWTSRDLEMNPNMLRRVVERATGLTAAPLRRAAAQYEKGVNK